MTSSERIVNNNSTEKMLQTRRKKATDIKNGLKNKSTTRQHSDH